ncbi:MAG: sensor histidine kinase, partial [Aggregatilineales bacterium]
ENFERLAEARDEFLKDVVKRLEQRIRLLEAKNTELQRVDQMKDSFIQLAAHELRTPLTLITGYMKLLEEHETLLAAQADDADFDFLFDALSESVTRMHLTVEEILTISRIMTRKIELNITHIQPAAIMKKVIAEYEDPLQHRKHALQFDETQYPDEMQADAGLLTLTFNHLLSNAIKYTPDGGTLRIHAQHNENAIRLHFKDSGVGIAPEDQQTIFNRMHASGDITLHTTSKWAFEGGGLGLGLAICKGIVEAHGGTITVRSPGYDREKLPGSEFIVTLPLIARKYRRVQSKSNKFSRLAARHTTS